VLVLPSPWKCSCDADFWSKSTPVLSGIENGPYGMRVHLATSADDVAKARLSAFGDGTGERAGNRYRPPLHTRPYPIDVPVSRAGRTLVQNNRFPAVARLQEAP